MKNHFYELEDLVDKIKVNNDDKEINMGKVDVHIQEYRKSIEQIIAEKNIKAAKALIYEIDSYDFNLRNIVTGNGLDVEYLNIIDNNFDDYNWKDAVKARQLVNQGLQLVAGGRTASVRAILVQVITLMPDNQKPNDTLG